MISLGLINVSFTSKSIPHLKFSSKVNSYHARKFKVSNLKTTENSENCEENSRSNTNSLEICRRSSLLAMLFTLNSNIVFTSSSKSEETSCLSSLEGVTKRVFLDVAIDGKPAGRITIGVYGNDVPVGANRFSELAIGKKGVSLKKKEFVKVLPNYIQNNGVKSFNITGTDSGAANFSGGENADLLLEELKAVQGTKPYLTNLRGSVSLVVSDPTIPPPKSKLIAKNGGFVTVEEVIRPPPNGTEFVIITKDSSNLDETNLVVGRVLEGWETIEKISSLDTVKENTESPYFKAAKMIGDSRATVAERGFNRPYAKVVITKCGALEV